MAMALSNKDLRIESEAERNNESSLNSNRKFPNVFSDRDGYCGTLTDVLRGRSAFLIAGGPSFSTVDKSLLSQPGILTMGLNNSVKTFRPNLWTAVDPPEKFLKSIWFDPGILKFVREENLTGPLFDNELWSPLDTTPDECPCVIPYRSNTHFGAENFLSENSVNWGNGPKNGGGRSVLLAALKLLYCLGAGQVFLLGVDFSMAQDSPYHFDQAKSPTLRTASNRAFGKISSYLEKLQPKFESAGFRVWNCNPDSKLTVFPHLSFAEAVEIATSEMPASIEDERSEGLYERVAGGNDSIDAELPAEFTEQQKTSLRRVDRSKRPELIDPPSNTSSPPPDNSGILLLADGSSEWLLPWWHHHYTATNSHLPVAVVAKDLSSEARAFLKSVEFQIVEVDPSPEKADGWFFKPFAISQSPFAHTVFLDLDCELRKNINSILAWSQSGIVLGKDLAPKGKYRALFRGDCFFNSGVVGVLAGSPVVTEWQRETRQLADRMRGDQEILNLVLYENEAKVVVLPPHFHKLRLEGDHPEASIMHWTGPAGKKHIREQIRLLHLDTFE